MALPSLFFFKIIMTVKGVSLDFEFSHSIFDIWLYHWLVHKHTCKTFALKKTKPLNFVELLNLC